MRVKNPLKFGMELSEPPFSSMEISILRASVKWTVVVMRDVSKQGVREGGREGLKGQRIL